MKAQKKKDEQKLQCHQHRKKIIEHRIPELDRKTGTHRLCTCGGMLERFLLCPGELTDEQMMDLSELSFCQQKGILALAKTVYGVQAARNVSSHLD